MQTEMCRAVERLSNKGDFLQGTNIAFLQKDRCVLLRDCVIVMDSADIYRTQLKNRTELPIQDAGHTHTHTHTGRSIRNFVRNEYRFVFPSGNSFLAFLGKCSCFFQIPRKIS
jgi:hypothetical protein